MGRAQWNTGYHAGRKSVWDEIRAAAEAARKQQQAQRTANRIEVAATVTSSVILAVAPIAWNAWKGRRRKNAATPDAAPSE